ncbi:alkaline phosphatase family protein [Nesterenkonia flava]|uniref:Alkaline phosphatase family protein n=1 Tax=Nesterenkonia flava TaxID=469799 RepID=A0ABU1FTT5_9MICC|nr:alkaline phosphatase family protein [Nesterenkonia flava]MDR5712075.1 alkaline phosphatase family protein [Nesterenkonia flava]
MLAETLPPAPDYDGGHLRHVMTSAAAALGLEGFQNRLGIAEASIAVVVLADGLGDHQLAAHTGHARFLASAWRRASTGRTLDSGAPTTTASSLSCLGTGLTPGEHGMVGYDLRDPSTGRVVNMLGGWDSAVDPHAWQPHPTVLGRAQAQGAAVLTASRAEFAESGLTQAVLSGGEFVGATRIDARFRAALDWILAQRAGTGASRQGPPQPILVYLYVDELDKTGHKYGVDSDQWRVILEALDAAAEQFCGELSRRWGRQASVLLSADHGMVTVPESGKTDISAWPDLMASVHVTAGEPRFLHLYTEPEPGGSATTSAAHEVARRWREALGERAWILTREEALRAGWFTGDESAAEPWVLPRLGDVMVAAKEGQAFYDLARTGTGPLTMVGQHGSFTEAERRVPLLELTGRPFVSV